MEAVIKAASPLFGIIDSSRKKTVQKEFNMTHAFPMVSSGFRIILYLICSFLLIFQNPCVAANRSEEGIDLFFVVDNSGSMRKNDPQFMMPRTVKAFLEGLPWNTRVGLVMFDQQAHLLAPLSSVADMATRQQLVQNLEQIDYRGKFTDSAAGISWALQEFKADSQPAPQRCIIFLTDGIVDTGNKDKDRRLVEWLKKDLTMESRKEGIRIFGIAFTDNADHNLTETLSKQTGGAHYQIANADDIDSVLEDIKSQLITQQALSEPTAPPTTAPMSPAPSPPAAEPTEPPKAAAVSPAEEQQAPAVEPHPPLKSASTTADQSRFKPFMYWIIILIGLIVILAFLVFKFFVLGKRKVVEKSSERFQAGAEAAPAMEADLEQEVPQWQLLDLDQPENPATDFNLARVTIGRDKHNDFVLSQSTVSTMHAKIEYRDKLFFLEDLRSTNGTRLNGRTIKPGQPTLIKSGDHIKFADQEFKFERPDYLISGNTISLTITSLSLKQEDLDPSVVIRADDKARLKEALTEHLNQVKALGHRYSAFVDQHFTSEVIQSLTNYAQENMRQTTTDSDQHCRTMINGQTYFIVCTLPVPIEHASAWFNKRFGGFSRFVLQSIHSDAYEVTGCDVLCIITLGFDKGHWVSVTIVPTNGDDDDPVEIVSIEFLTESEKAELAIDFDEKGRVL